MSEERLFLLSLSRGQEADQERTGKRTTSNKPDAWQELLADKAALIRHNVTPQELEVLSHISLLGVLKPRHFLFILNSIRQATRQ